MSSAEQTNGVPVSLLYGRKRLEVYRMEKRCLQIQKICISFCWFFFHAIIFNPPEEYLLENLGLVIQERMTRMGYFKRLLNQYVLHFGWTGDGQWQLCYPNIVLSYGSYGVVADGCFTSGATKINIITWPQTHPGTLPENPSTYRWVGVITFSCLQALLCCPRLCRSPVHT